jgi:hypothetical protein
VPTPPAHPTSPAPPPGSEASTRTVQNILFILGGLLVGTAAVIFTVVAWGSVGVAGRAVILAALTALALAAPPLATWRRLTATAETFAALGLLLVVLDGFAAWSVNLFGVADWPTTRYAALAGGVSAAVAAGYGVATRLATPWFAAFLVAQPVLPLLAVEARLGATGWALVLAAVAAADLAVVGLLRQGRADAPGPGPGPGATVGGPIPVPAGGARPGTGVSLARQVLAWLGCGGTLLVSALCGLSALLALEGPGPAGMLSGAPLLVTILLAVAAAVLVRSVPLQAVSGALLVAALGAAAIRPVAETDWPFLAVTAVIVAVLAAGASATGRLLPVGVRLGPRAGALLLAGPLAVTLTTMVIAVSALLALRSLPGGGSAGDPVDLFDWQLPAAVPLLAGALAILLPGAARWPVALLGGVLTVLAVPVTVGAPWWVAVLAELAVAVPLLLGAARSGPARPVLLVLCAASGAALAGHALLVSLADPGVTSATLATLALTGTAVAALAAPDREASADLGPAGLGYRRVIGGLGLAVALPAVPAAVAASLAAAGVPPWWQARAALTVVVLLAATLLAVYRWWPAYQSYAGGAVALSALVTGLVPEIAGLQEPSGVYAAVGLLVVAVRLLTAGDGSVPAGPGRMAASAVGLIAGVVLLVRSLVAAAPAVFAVLVRPYGWFDAVWDGVPEGVGLAPYRVAVPVPAVAVLALLAVVAAIGGWLSRRTRMVAALAALPLGLLALLVLLAAVGAPWPVVPASALLTGLGCLAAAALTDRGVRGAPVAVPLGVVVVGGALAGLLPTEASTLTGLGLAAAVTATIGVAGRRVGARVAGWLVAAGAGMLLGITAAAAAEQPAWVASLGVLAVAAVALAGGAALSRSRPAEAVALETAAHAGAVVALLLAAGQLRYAAAVCTLWGVALGLRALPPGESARRRWLLAAAAAASELVAVWLLLVVGEVAVLEAYTLPAALLGLVAGWLAIRAWPGRNSWLGYGPGLSAALLPSLASVLVAGDQPWRRLLLGTGALVVVLTGARWRRQAPVVLGGVTLAVVAVHELVGVWDRLPRWVFLAVGGFLLIGLAMTYERRRRDVARLRSAVGRMT